MNNIIAYGSLRLGESWYQELKHNLLWSNQINYVSTIGLNGFKLYKVRDPEDDTFHNWVACKYTEKQEDHINGDLIEVSDTLYEYIKEVIEHSDFIPLMKIVGNKNCELYLYNGKVEEQNLINNVENTNSNNKEVRLQTFTTI